MKVKMCKSVLSDLRNLPEKLGLSATSRLLPSFLSDSGPCLPLPLTAVWQGGGCAVASPEPVLMLVLSSWPSYPHSFLCVCVLLVGSPLLSSLNTLSSPRTHGPLSCPVGLSLRE